MIGPEQQELLECVAARFRALSDVSRLRILLHLAAEDRCVSDLQARLGHSQAAVSKHLAVLRAAGLVDSSRRKNRVFYHVADRGVFDLCTLVCDGVRRRLKSQQLLLTALQPPRRPPTVRRAPARSQGASR